MKCVTTIDHISAGRAIMGIGGAWFEGEHRAFGIDFGTGFGQRLDWLAEAVGGCRVAARRRRGDEPARRPLRLRSPADRAAAGPARTCRSWSVGRGTEDAPDRRRARRHLERVRDARDPRPQGRGPARALRGRSDATRRRSSAPSAARSRSARPQAEAERVRQRDPRAQPHAARTRRRATPPSGPARPSRSPRR